MNSEQSQGYFATVSQSVSLGIESLWVHDQILAVVKTGAVLFVMGRPPCRQNWSVL